MLRFPFIVPRAGYYLRDAGGCTRRWEHSTLWDSWSWGRLGVARDPYLRVVDGSWSDEYVYADWLGGYVPAASHVCHARLSMRQMIVHVGDSGVERKQSYARVHTIHIDLQRGPATSRLVLSTGLMAQGEQFAWDDPRILRLRRPGMHGSLYECPNYRCAPARVTRVGYCWRAECPYIQDTFPVFRQRNEALAFLRRTFGYRSREIIRDP